MSAYSQKRAFAFSGVGTKDHIILGLNLLSKRILITATKKTRQGETCNKGQGSDGRRTLRHPKEDVVNRPDPAPQMGVIDE